MDITLKSALIVSSMIHAAVAVPLYHNNMFRSDFIKKDPAIVDYIILKEMSNISIANAGRKDATTYMRDQGRIDAGKPLEQPRAAAKHTRSEYLKRFETARIKEFKRELAKRPDAELKTEAARNDEEIRATKDYQDYYGFLKEKIKTRLQENYRFYKGEGDVYVSFVLGSKGQLLSYTIDRERSVRDEVLLHITGTSLMAVSPFPPLPKVISEPKMSFGITISFKK